MTSQASKENSLAPALRRWAADTDVRRGPSSILLNGAADEIERLRTVLDMAAWRFRDLATIVRGKGPYTDAAFLDASADRCFAALSGETEAKPSELERLRAREAAARKILEPLHDCDPDIREWLKS